MQAEINAKLCINGVLFGIGLGINIPSRLHQNSRVLFEKLLT
jgi:hypothetical protein